MITKEIFYIGRLLVPIFFIIIMYFSYKFYFKEEIQKIKCKEGLPAYWFYYLKSVILVFVLYHVLLILKYLSGSLVIQAFFIKTLLLSYAFILTIFGIGAILIKTFGFDKIENFYPQGVKGWVKLLIMVIVAIFVIIFLIIINNNLNFIDM